MRKLVRDGDTPVIICEVTETIDRARGDATFCNAVLSLRRFEHALQLLSLIQPSTVLNNFASHVTSINLSDIKNRLD